MDCLEQCHPVVIVTPLHTGDDLKHCGTTRGKEGGTVAQLGGGAMWYNWGGMGALWHCGTTRGREGGTVGQLGGGDNVVQLGGGTLWYNWGGGGLCGTNIKSYALQLCTYIVHHTAFRIFCIKK